MLLPDVLENGLSLVICGTAPGRTSMLTRNYYAHPGNIFWITLYQAGLTPTKLDPNEYERVLDYGIGLTGLNKMDWGADADLSPENFDLDSFSEKMRSFRPKVIAFESKFAACKFFGKSRVEYGFQEILLDNIPIYVCPSTSGRARRYFDLSIWEKLAGFIKCTKK